MWGRVLLTLFWGIFAAFAINSAAASANGEPSASKSDAIEVMNTFNAQRQDEGGVVKVEERRKHQIIFYLAVPLLLCLLITAALGLAMVVFGKPVFLAHMIFAGLSVTLALAHAVVGIVWFYPF
ncbi:MAG: hypothetical protein OEW08_07930 [Gammaproteobacteria bacterium]|nr:hypothetical protein [Gammaproteobacteria bacterium]